MQSPRMRVSSFPASAIRGGNGEHTDDGSGELVRDRRGGPGLRASHLPSEPFLIPTTLGLVGSDGLTLGPASYPVGEAQRFDWTPVVLDVYRGRIEIDVPVRVETGAIPGRRTVSGRVRYQGCTANACLPPAELSVEVDLEVMGKEEEERT